jgi:hypothetical protein
MASKGTKVMQNLTFGIFFPYTRVQFILNQLSPLYKKYFAFFIYIGVLDQIRDLQSFIDDFVVDGKDKDKNIQICRRINSSAYFSNFVAGTTSPVIISPEEKTELVLAEPLTKETILQKPDEKTEVEEEKKVTEAVEEDKKTAEPAVEEKILVEATPTPSQQAPLTILSYDLNLSDDFSSLLTQFKEIKVSPIDINMFKKQQTFMDVAPKDDKEKIQVDVTLTNMKNGAVPTPVATTPKFSNSFLLNDFPSNASSSGKSRSRRTSVSSKTSKKSQRSAKSAKSAKSTRSARRLQNEKKLQQQQKQEKQQQPQKYVERSYDEMMRIPDIYERVAFYEKTLDLCLKADSPISNWCKSNKEKGKPQPLLEGYVPPIRLLSPEVPMSENTFGNMSTTFSGSISMFLKKAGGGSQSISKKNSVLENKSFLVPSSSYTPQTPSNYSLTGSSGVFGRSMSRLNLSRTTQIPRYDKNPIMIPAATRLAPLYNNRVSLADIPSTPKKRSSINTMNKALSPLNMDYNNHNHRDSLRTPKSSSSTPSSFGSTTTINSQGEFTNQSSALNYMVNVLPQIDLRILQNALDEAKGDPMVAISIAVSQNKLAAHNHHNRSGDNIRSSKKSSSRNSRHYKVK